jgi:hypothetical protein
MKMEVDFRSCKIKTKVKEVQNSPSCAAPFQVDCRTGQVRIMFANVLQKVDSVKGKKQPVDCRKLFKALIRVNAGYFETDEHGKLVVTGTAGEELPHWTKHVIVAKYESKEAGSPHP